MLVHGKKKDVDSGTHFAWVNQIVRLGIRDWMLLCQNVGQATIAGVKNWVHWSERHSLHYLECYMPSFVLLVHGSHFSSMFSICSCLFLNSMWTITQGLLLREYYLFKSNFTHRNITKMLQVNKHGLLLVCKHWPWG